MSISSVGGTTPQASPYASYPAKHGVPKAGEDSDKELTTVTTHCDKKHEHNMSCPHSTSTKPAAQAGEPGSFIDESI